MENIRSLARIKMAKESKRNLMSMCNNTNYKINREIMIMKSLNWENSRIKKWINTTNKNTLRSKAIGNNPINYLPEPLNNLRNINLKFLLFKILNLWTYLKIKFKKNKIDKEKLMLKTNLKTNSPSQWQIEIHKTLINFILKMVKLLFKK